jgi:hypothetical protein
MKKIEAAEGLYIPLGRGRRCDGMAKPPLAVRQLVDLNRVRCDP